MSATLPPTMAPRAEAITAAALKRPIAAPSPQGLVELQYKQRCMEAVTSLRTWTMAPL
jgi:hypothetical protein